MLESSHFLCLTGQKFTISTWTAWCFSYFGGMMHKRYFTSSPGIGTYSPSTLHDIGMGNLVWWFFSSCIHLNNNNVHSLRNVHKIVFLAGMRSDEAMALRFAETLHYTSFHWVLQSSGRPGKWEFENCGVNKIWVEWITLCKGCQGGKENFDGIIAINFVYGHFVLEKKGEQDEYPNHCHVDMNHVSFI